MQKNDSEKQTEAYRHPNEKISSLLATGLALQLSCLLLPSIAMIPTIVFRTAGESEAMVLWAVFASVVICGIVSTLHAMRFGRSSSGYIIAVGTAGVAIAASVKAIQGGGPELLATLVIAMALVQILFSRKLLLFRRILTPTVTGTVMLLLPVTVMPILFDQLTNVTEGASELAAPLCAITTLAVIVGLMLVGSGSLRLWSPLIGIIAGSIVAGLFGIYDFDRVLDASWVGIPAVHWPGVDLEFGPLFWGLLPAFVFIALVCTIQQISGSVAIQRVSWRPVRAVDFRSVQSAIGSEGVGNMIAGFAGIAPLGYRPTGATMVEITGVSSRYVGFALGFVLIAIAFLPKLLAAILAIPGPIVAAFITVMMATIFIIGMKIVVQDGVDYRKGTIVGISFWLGVGFENNAVFPNLFSELAGGLFQNGMVVGGACAILMTLLLELTSPRRRQLDTELEISALAPIQEFLSNIAIRNRWGEKMIERLHAVSEETLLTLLQGNEFKEDYERRHLRIVAYTEANQLILEFVASTSAENIQDRIALLGEKVDLDQMQGEMSLRLLRHLSSSVHHQQYHDSDILTIRVDVLQTKSEKRT